MFAPSNLATTNSRTKATNKDGYLEIETNETYGDLNSTWDVVMAWMALSSVWQKLFPDWPVANIGMRTIFTMKLFAHCGKEDKRIMVDYSNKFLKANALRAANKEPPMDFSRSMNLAGNVCHQRGFEREPPAARSLQLTHASGRGGGNSTSSFRGRGSYRGGPAGPNRAATQSHVTLPTGEKVCHYWQSATCKEQSNQSCTRNNVKYIHACSFIKPGGQVCGRKDHKKSEHDVTKH